jgi:hypothetical protein
VLLTAWLAAALLAGLPGGAGSRAHANTRAAAAPKITHSGPECLAGHAAPPKTNGKQ